MNRVVHFEIHAAEPERAAKFYSALFGWTVAKWDGPMPYWMVNTGSDATGIHGGIVLRRGPAPVQGQSINSFVCTVDVENVDASFARAVELGATVAVPKMPIPGVGWLAYMKDTEGNIFGMMQNDPQAK